MVTSLIAVLDDAFQAAFEAMCAELSHAGIRTLVDDGVPAHVTVALGEGFDRVDYSSLALPGPVHVGCDAVATFGSVEGCWFLTVRPHPSIQAAIDAVHTYLHGIPVQHSPWYLPDTLLPHVTVAMDVPAEQQAKAIEIMRWHVPLEGTATRLELWDDETVLRRL